MKSVDVKAAGVKSVGVGEEGGGVRRRRRRKV